MLTDDICVRQLLHHFDTLHRPLTYMQNEHVHREGFSTFMSTRLPLFHVTATAQWLWVAVLIAQYCIIVMRHAGGKGMEPRSGKGQAHTYIRTCIYTKTCTHSVFNNIHTQGTNMPSSILCTYVHSTAPPDTEGRIIHAKYKSGISWWGDTLRYTWW